MFRTILVPLDGSRLTEQALPWAARFARQGHCPLRLVVADHFVPAMVSSGDSMALGHGWRDEVVEYLVRTADHWRRASGITVEHEIVDGGGGLEVTNASEGFHGDLVVLASHGRGEQGGYWSASVRDYLVRHLQASMLVVRSVDGIELAPPGVELRRLLVPLDGSPPAETVLAPAGALASLTQSHLTLFRVIEPGADAGSRERDAQRYLDQVADRLRAQGHRVAARVVTADDPAVAIERALDRLPFDLVAMRARGTRTGEDLAPVTEHVMHNAKQPILLTA